MNEVTTVLSTTDESAPSDPFDELPVAYVEMDARGAITRANRLTRSIHSSHAGELIGRLAWELMPATDQEMSRAAFKAAMDSNQDPPVAKRSLYTSSGHFRMHELHRNIIRDADGHPTGMRVVTLDVTETYKAHEETLHARQWLESVIASLPEAVIVTDALGFIRTVNPATEALFGWKAAELKGKVIESALPVLAYHSQDRMPLNFTMALSKPTQGVATMLDRERREVRVEICASPIVDGENGGAAGVVSILRPMLS
jgi:two-component system sensor kinase FixL